MIMWNEAIIQKRVSKFIKKALSVILVGAFLLTGIPCWAAENSNLSPELRTSASGFKKLCKAAAICCLIEKTGKIGNALSFKFALARLPDAKKGLGSIRLLTSPNEVTIEVPDEGLVVRYFNPAKASTVTPYSDISKLETKVINPRLSRQIMHRTQALPSESSSRASASGSRKYTAKEATKICDTFNRLGIIPSYTVKKEPDLDLVASENKGVLDGIESFNGLFEASTVKIPHSIEVDRPTTDLVEGGAMQRFKASAFYAGNCTYHLRKIGDNVVNLALPEINFRNIVDNSDNDLPSIIKTLNPTYISVHLGWGAEDIALGVVDSHDVANSKPLPGEVLLKRIVRNLLVLKGRLEKAGYDKPILLETLDYYKADAKGAYDNVTNPKFIREVLLAINREKMNVRLLVDCGHLLVAAKNNGIYIPEDFMQYVKDVVNEDTIGLIDEVHMVVPVFRLEKEIDKYVDIHQPLYSSGIAADEVKQILKYIFSLRKQLKIVHPVIVNFETGIQNAEKELGVLADELKATASRMSASGNHESITKAPLSCDEKYIILDMDGVILDTITINRRNAAVTFCKIFNGILPEKDIEFGMDMLKVGEKFYDDRLGRSTAENIKEAIALTIERGIQVSGHPADLAKRYDDDYKARRDAETIRIEQGDPNDLLLPGAREFIVKKYSEGRKLFIASSTASRTHRLSILRRTGIEKYFSGIYIVQSLEDKSDIIAQILEENKIKPEEALFIDDSPIAIIRVHERVGDRLHIIGMPSTPRNKEMMERLGVKGCIANLGELLGKENDTPLTVRESASGESYKSYLDKNQQLFKDMLSESKQDILLRVPIETIEAIGRDNIDDFLATFQVAQNGYVELYHMSGTGDVSESVYQKYGLQKKALPKDFKRTRENTITLFPVLKGEEISQSMIAPRLGNIDMTAQNTILSPMGLQNDTAGLIRSTVLGLKIMEVAREVRKKGANNIDMDEIQLRVLEDLKIICDVNDMKGLTAEDIINLAVSNDINSIMKALKKLINLLPITPIDADELRHVYEHAKAVITAA